MELTESIIQHSGSIINWCLSIIGGSILVVIGSDYVRPISKKIRLIYLLFIPGWFCLGYSIKMGVNVANQKIIADLMRQNETELFEIVANMGTEYTHQLYYFNLGLLFFGIWILAFLLFWIYGKI